MLAVVFALPGAAGNPNPTSGDQGPSARALQPLDRLAGLPLVLRTVLTLQKAGAQRICLLIRAGRGELVDRVRSDRRVQVELDSVEVEEGESPIGALHGRLAEPFVLGRFDVVAAPAVYQLLFSAEDVPELGLLATDDDGCTGLLRGTPALLERLASGDGATRSEDDARALTELAEDGGLGRLDVAGRWWVDLNAPDGRRRAADHLFEDCRKAADGVISRRFNRHVSLFISKRLVDTPLSPNAATGLTFAVALAAAAVTMSGGYWNTLIGASLMQLNSILDGVDGELARVRFQQSKLGQWLDTLGDDGSNLLFYAALALGARQLPYGELLSACGWIAAAATAVTAALYYIELVRKGSGDLNVIEWDFAKQRPSSLGGWLLVFFRYVFKQDAFIFLLWVTAAAGVVSHLLPLWAGGGVATMIAAATRHLPRRQAAGGR